MKKVNENAILCIVDRRGAIVCVADEAAVFLRRFEESTYLKQILNLDSD